MKDNDRINWNYSPNFGGRPAVPIAGVVRKVSDKRVTIEVALKIQGEWIRKTKSVSPATVSIRTTLARELGEMA